MTTKHEHRESQRDAAQEPARSANAKHEQEQHDPLDDLSDIVGLSASVHGKELRVDEAICRTEQGDTKVHRVGLPPTGAEHGVTYKDITVTVEIAGQPPKKKSG